MNAWSARGAMNGNKAKTALCALAALWLYAPACLSAGSAPALLGVQEIIVRAERIGDEDAAGSCLSQIGDGADLVLKKLKEDNLPAFSVMDAPSNTSAARIDLQPEILTLQRQGLDCISWVSLTAQSRETLQVLPVRPTRNVMVTYWRGGLIVSSTRIAHPRAVGEALAKLAQGFSRQYRADQPPPLPELE